MFETDADPNSETPAPRQRLVLLTGPSGAGRSTAINALEDFGYEAIDNLPLSLLPRLLTGPMHSHPLALGIDARNREFTTLGVLESIEDLASRAPLDFDVLYLDCRDDVLLRRYSETRRRHPLAPDESPTVGIEREKQLLQDIKDRADILIDTSEMSPHALRAEMSRFFSLAPLQNLAVSIHSFSYKRGLPRSADMVFDCRFLQNPHWVPDLRAMTGRDDAIVRYVSEDPRFDEFMRQITELTTSLLPAYRDEGKSHFSVALGCTGGKHRSVAVAEKLAAALAQGGWQVSIRHRELERHAHSATQKATLKPKAAEI